MRPYAISRRYLGSAENWTLPNASLRLASEHREDDSLRAIVYQGATHSWDEPGGTRTIFNGALLAFDPVATEASIRASGDFQMDRLRR